MKRVRSSFEGISVEDAMLSVLLDTASIVSVDLATTNPTLSADFTRAELIRGLNILIEKVPRLLRV